MYSDYPSIVFYILLLLMLSSGIVYIAKESLQRFILQILIWAAIFIGFLGAVLVVRPGSDIFTWNSILPIGASFCYALSIVTLRSFKKEISNSILYLYSATAAALGAGFYATFSITFTPIQSYSDAILLLSMSFCGGFGVVCLMIAYRSAEVPPLLHSTISE